MYKFLKNAGAELLPVCHGTVRTTLLHTAVALQSVEAISLIAKSSSALSFSWDKHGLTPMHLAVSLRLQAPLKALLHSQIAGIIETDKQESDISDLVFVDTKDFDGNTPLHVAVTNEWKAGVCILLEAGADVCERNSNGETVVHLAAESGNYDMLKEILSIHESKTVRHKSLSSSSTVNLQFLVSVYSNPALSAGSPSANSITRGLKIS